MSEHWSNRVFHQRDCSFLHVDCQHQRACCGTQNVLACLGLHSLDRAPRELSVLQMSDVDKDIM